VKTLVRKKLRPIFSQESQQRTRF